MKTPVRNRLEHSDLELFHHQLTLLLDTGLPLPEGLRRFARDARDPSFRESLSRLAAGLEEGETLSGAMAREERYFPPDYTALVRVGEQGGDLVRALDTAMDQVRFQQGFRDLVRRTIYYPLVVVLTITLVYVAVVVFTMPMYARYYEQGGLVLPWMARAVYGTWAGRAAGPLAAALLALVLVFRRPGPKLAWHRFLLVVPLLRRVLVERFLASFSAGLAVLVQAGAPLPESLNLMARVTLNRHLAADLARAASSAETGAGLSSVLESLPVFTPTYREVAAAGEKGGALAETLAGLARMYRAETLYHSSVLVQALELGLLLAAGLWTSWLVVGMYSLYWNFFTVYDRLLAW